MDGTWWFESGDVARKMRAPSAARVRVAALLLCLLSADGAAQDTLAVDSNGRSAAGVVFGGALTDDDVRELLRRYNVLPYAVHFSGAIGGFRDVPPEQASLELIAETRRRTVGHAERWTCQLIGRGGRRARQSEPHVRPAPGERDLISRLRLTEVERARAIREGVLRGELAIHSVALIGRVEDVRRLRADPRVRDFRAGQLVRNGLRREFVVGGLWPPHKEPPRITPEVDALSAEEVRARLDRLVSQPPPECRETLRNVDAEEPTVRPQAVPGRPGAYAAAGLIFHAESRVGAQRGPGPGEAPTTRMRQHVRVVLTVSNPSNGRIETPIRGCTALLRVYRANGRTDPPVLDRSRGIQCEQDPTVLALGPGESRTFVEGADVWHILRDSFPEGRYALAMFFRLADETLEIPAGEVALQHPSEGLAFHASTVLAGRELRARGVVTNTTTRPIHIEFGDCALVLRAYRRADRSDRPVWDSRSRAPWAGSYGRDCLAYGATRTLGPGQTMRPDEFTGRFPLIEILGDSLPDGRYYFSASLRINHVHTPEFAAGSLRLSLPRPPLPASQTANAVVYRAATEPDAAAEAAIHTTVIATLAHAGGSRLRYSFDCPVTLYAYRSRARRDAAPRSGEPDWKSPPRCGPELQEMWLQRGDSRAFQVRASAREILGSRLPPGRYYFVAVVREERRTVYLSAGDAELTR
jgi:hypothetical protein